MSNKSDENHSCVSLFLRSRVTFWATVARMVLILELVPTTGFGSRSDNPLGSLSSSTLFLVSSWLKSPALSAILEDPTFTLRHVREARAIRNLFATKHLSKFNHSYRLPNTIHLPPLLLAALDSFYNITSVIHRGHHPYIENILFGILILAVDLLIGLLLERITRRVLGRNNNNSKSFPAADHYHHQNTDEWEESLEKNVPEAVRPPLVHIFEIYEHTNSDEDNDEHSNNVTSRGCTLNDLREKESSKSSPPSSSSQSPPPPPSPPPLIRLRDIPLGVALLYYASPVTILSGSVFFCIRNVSLVALLWAMDLTVSGSSKNVALASLALAMSAYMDVHNVIFVIPLSIMQKNTSQNNNFYHRGQLQLATMFLLYFSCLHGLSFLLVGQGLYRSVLVSTHLYSFQIINIRPSLSTLWYFGMEMFDRFHVYFSVFLGGIPYLLVFPLTIRLHRYPTVLIAIFWMLGVVFRPPGTLYNLNVGLCMLGWCPRSLIRLRTIVSTVAVCAFPVPTVLFVVTHWLWLETGSGEANFCYFQCLAYNVFVGLLLVEFTGASLRRDKALRMTEKLLLSSSASKKISNNSVDDDGLNEQIQSSEKEEELKVRERG